MSLLALWPAVGALAAALASVLLLVALADKRDRPGATWLLVVLGVQFLLTASYGVGYFVTAPALRWLAEAAFWVSASWIGATFMAFGLTYTGRGDVVRSAWFAPVTGGAGLLSVLVVTNPWHHLVWSDFHVAVVDGLATAQYTREGGAVLLLGMTMLGAAVGTLLLVETVVSYGSMYRRQAIAIGLSPIPPGIGFVCWTFGVVPAPGINLAPALFLVHVALDAYAYLGGGLFAYHPATRRAGNRAAIDDLANPVVVVDDEHRVVTLNPAAASAFGVAVDAVRTEPLSACYDGAAIDPTRPEQTAEITVDGRTRVFKITSTPLESGDAHLGHTLVFNDVTAERQREQRLAVMNRVLRHNLRNDLTVVDMRLDQAIDAGDDDLAESLGVARETVNDLVALGEKARTFDRLPDDPAPERVQVAALVAEVVDGLGEQFPEATVAVEGVESATVTCDRATLRVVLANLVENALEHGVDRSAARARADGAADVTVTVERGADSVRVAISDRGPGVPDHELAVLADGDETALEHGSGLGLWLVQWGATALGADVDFETSEAGTTATVTLSRAESTADGERPGEPA
ncbi:MAG: histidine kinase N-terminal 7TM domain-containing protein [Haloarculaceae archaeon]